MEKRACFRTSYLVLKLKAIPLRDILRDLTETIKRMWMCSSIDESRFLPETEIYNITRENDFNFFKLETLAPITNDVRFDRRNIRGEESDLASCFIYHESFHTRVLKDYIFTCFFCTHCIVITVL